MYDLVLFDLDGTLVDTAPDIADSVNAVLKDRRLPLVTQPWVRDRIGHGTRALLLHAYANAAGVSDEVAAEHGVLDALLDEFGEAYAKHCGRRGRLYPDAGTTLAALRDHRAQLALVTNKEQRFVRLLLEVHGLDGEFDIVVCGDSLAEKKPKPLPVQHCLEVLKVPAARALFVGDSEIDVLTARAAGVAIWAVNYGYNQRRPIGASEPDRVISRLSVIREAFDEAKEKDERASYSPRASSSSLYLRSNPRN
jgi:phosphoglycolate phosphatase